MIIEQISKFELYTKEKQDYIYKLFLEEYVNLNDEDIFTSLLSLRRYVIQGLAKNTELEYIDIIFYLFNRNEKIRSSLIDMLGSLYKFMSINSKGKIYENINKYIELNKTLSPRETVSITTFIKNIYKDLSEIKQKNMKEIILKIYNKAEEELKPTINYNNRCMDREFNEQGDTLILIPEFLTGSTFLQMPIEILNCMSRFTDEKRPVLLDNRIYSYNIKELATICKEFKIVIILSSTTDQHITYNVDYRFEVFKQTVNKIREVSKKNKIVICGAHGTVRSDIVMKECNCDIIVRGEVDISLIEIISKLRLDEELNEIPNLVIRHKDKIIETEKSLEHMHPVDWGECYSNYDIIDCNDYFGYYYYGNVHLKLSPWGIIQTTRGCPYKCSFCYNFFGNRIRTRSKKFVIDELKKIKNKGITTFFIMDQTFTLNREYSLELCKEMISLNLNLKWYCQTRVGFVDPELLKVMKQAGCIGIWLGIESFDDNILVKNKKGYSSSELMHTLRDIDDSGINYHGFIMLGMMGETVESIKNTTKTIKDKNIKLTQSIMVSTPRFGAELYEILEEKYNVDLDSFFKLEGYKGRIDVKISQEELNDAMNELVEYVSVK